MKDDRTQKFYDWLCDNKGKFPFGEDMPKVPMPINCILQNNKNIELTASEEMSLEVMNEFEEDNDRTGKDYDKDFLSFNPYE